MGLVTFATGLLGSIVGGAIMITTMGRDIIEVKADIAGIHEDVKSIDKRLIEVDKTQAVLISQMGFLYDRAKRPIGPETVK